MYQLEKIYLNYLSNIVKYIKDGCKGTFSKYFTHTNTMSVP